MPSLSVNQLDILKHTSRTGRYVSDEPDCHALASAALLKDFGPQKLAGGNHYFTLTSAGREALNQHLASLPEPPPVPKRKQRARERYRRFLDYGDGFKSFRDFLGWDMDPQRAWNQSNA